MPRQPRTRPLLLALALLAVAVDVRAQTTGLEAPTLFAGELEPLPDTFPYSCALADLDGDSRLDALVVHGSSLSVLFGREDVRFGERVTVPLDTSSPLIQSNDGPYPAPPVVADLDADGFLDVLVLQRQPSSLARVLLLAGRRGGRLAPVATLLQLDGLRALTTGDFDGDGHLDLALARTLGGQGSFLAPPEGTTELFLARGTGAGFDAPTLLASFPQTGTDHLFASDTDDDARLDLIAVIQRPGPDHIVTLVGRGDGSFAAPRIDRAAETILDAALADLDHDGNLDLVTTPRVVNITQLCRALSVQRAHDGRFGAPVEHSLCAPGANPLAGRGPFGATGPIALRDFDGDGHVDVFCSGFDGLFPRTTLLAGDGRGNFAPPVSLDMPAYPSLAAGDLDADGDADLIGAFWNLHVVENLGAARFSTVVPHVGPRSSVRTPSLLPVDVDADGDTDLVGVGPSGTHAALIALLNDGHGRFDEPPHKVAFERAFVNVLASDLQAGDLDADGDLDFVIADLGGDALEIFLGDADALFTHHARVTLGATPRHVALADLDADGDLDAAVSVGDAGRVLLLRGDGAGGLAIEGTLTRQQDLRDLALADLDADGLPELLTLSGEAHALAVSAGLGDLAFGPAALRVLGGDPRDLLIADLDGDGRLDALVADAFSPTGTVLAGDGTTNFGSATRLTLATSMSFAGSGWPRPTLADLDHDGLPDLVTRSHEGLVVRRGLPQGGFATPEGTPVAQAFSSPVPSVQTVLPALADFDGDGDLDVALTRATYDDVVILWNRLVR